jgi:peptidoglycan/LPS O-acetylase OafA/YrhL
LSTQRIRQLDGVRAVAILLVFVHHALNAKLLWLGVDVFFVLSGFLITGILLDAKNYRLGDFFARFYERRARRILAPYLVFLFVTSLFIGISWMKHWYLYILLTNFLDPLGIRHPSEFGPLWSLAVEEQFYLVWPFAVYFLNVRQLRRLCIALVLLAPVLRGTIHFALDWPIYELTPFRMDLLAFGGLICLEWRERHDRIEKWGLKIGLPLIAIGLAGLVLLAHFGYTTYGNTRVGNVLIYEMCLMIAVGTILYALGGKWVGWLKLSPMTYIGKVSYTMYLIHLLVLHLVLEHIKGYAGYAVALVLTIGYATVSWYLMESRLLKAGKAKPQKLVTAS